MLDRETMIWQILSLRNWNEEALRAKTDEEIQRIYEAVVASG